VRLLQRSSARVRPRCLFGSLLVFSNPERQRGIPTVFH
jgi:hypothetical protein